MKNETKKAILLTLLPALLFLPSIAMNMLPWFMDIVTQFYPYRYAMARQLHEFHLPFWTTSVFAGSPLLANIQLGFFFPFNWLFFALPGGASFTAAFAVSVFILGLGLYLWLRERKTPFIAAICAALILQVNGTVWAHVAFGAYLYVMALFPWLFYFYERMRRRRDSVSFIGMALITSLMIFAGAPQILFYTLFVIVIFTVFRLIPGNQRKKEIRIVSLTLGAVILGVGISAIQLIPSLLFISQTRRTGGLSMEVIRRGSLTFRRLLEAFLGNGGFPQDTGDVAYMGPATLSMAILGILASQRRRRWEDVLPPCLLILIGVLPASVLFAKLPVFGGFHDPRRVLALIPLTMAPLVGRGFTAFEIKRRTPAWLPGIYIASAVGTVLLFWGNCWNSEHASKLLQPALGWIPNLTFLGSCILSTILFVVIGLLLLWKLILKSTGRKCLLCLLAAFMFLEIMNYSFCRVDTKFIREERIRPERVRLLESDAKTDRAPRIVAYDESLNYSYNYMRTDFADSWLPNLAAAHGVSDFQGYDPLLSERYLAFLSILNGEKRLLYPSHFGIVRDFNSPLIRRAGITHSFGLPDDANTDGWEKFDLEGHTGPDIYRYKNAGGRFFFDAAPIFTGYASDSISPKQNFLTAAEILHNVKGGNQTVIEGSGDTDYAMIEKEAKIDTIEIREGYAKISIDAPSDGWLIFREQNYDGWSAKLNGKKVEIKNADLIYQAIKIAKGKHEIEWRHRSPGFTPGLIITLLSLIILPVTAKRIPSNGVSRY